MNVESLVTPLSADSPGGEDLVASGLLNELNAFRILGQRLPLPGEGPPGEKRSDGFVDWNLVRDRALAALARSRDLRVVPYLAAANLRLDGLTACLETLVVPAHWVDQFPEAVYPPLVGDGRAQLNALANLADPWAIVEPIRWKAFTSESADGSPSLLLLDQARGRVPAKSGTAKPDEARFRALVEAADRNAMVALARAARAATDSLSALSTFFRERVKSVPPVGKLQDELERLSVYLESILTTSPSKEAPAMDAHPLSTPESAASFSTIQTREDAVHALEGVIAYFERHEPSSVVPLLAERARRLVGCSFVEMVADLAPAAVDAVKSASGLKQAKDAGK